jgi:hypothetical protein
MARKRQARRCRARNRRGLPCGNFSVLGAQVCRMHGGSAPQVRRAARRALADDAAARMLRSNFDGRIAPYRLPPCRRETYLADRFRLRLTYDPLAQAVHQMNRDDFEARWSAAFREGYSRMTPLLVSLRSDAAARAEREAQPAAAPRCR